MNNTNRWTDRLHGREHDARTAAARTTDVMTRIFEDLRVLDAAELAIPRRDDLSDLATRVS